MFANRRNLLLAAIGSLAVCSVAQANSLAPFVLFWPGILHVSLIYSLPATILVAILERDFFCREGEQHGSLILSLRANLLSTIVGVLLTPASMIAIYSPFCLLLPFAAFAISCCVEIGYVRRFVDRDFPAWPLISANAISTGVLAFVPLIAEPIKELRPEWVWWLNDRWNGLLVATLIVSALVLVGAWIVPYRRRERDSSRDEARSNEASEEPQLASSK